MNDKYDDGGAAFPVLPPQDTAAGVATGYPYPEAGMTLRDYFAAKAIAGFLMAGEVGGQYVGFMECADWGPLAKHAYGIADAMLKARRAAEGGAS